MDTANFPIFRPLFEIAQLANIHFFTLCASARVGKTLFCICYLLWRISERPGPILWLDPTRKTALRFVRGELDHFIRECPPVWAKAIVSKTTWTALEKHFRGLVLRVVGSGSPADLAGYQAETLFANEVDRLHAVVDREAASMDLAMARTKQFEHTRMVMSNSTPTREDGAIWQDFLRGNQMYAYVRCPHCDALQRLTFWSEKKDVPFDDEGRPLPPGEIRTEETGRVRFEQFKKFDRVETEPGKWEDRERGYDIPAVLAGATYECAKCKADIEWCELNTMLLKAAASVPLDRKGSAPPSPAPRRGAEDNTRGACAPHDEPERDGGGVIRRYRCWIAHNPKADPQHVSAHLSALYSPFERWGLIAKKFILARGNLSKIVELYTLDLGIPFVHLSATIKDDDLDRVIRRCPQPYLKRQLPFEPSILTMTVDVGGYDFWWSVRAHGVLWDHPDMPFWSALVDWGQAVSWEQIEEIAGVRADEAGEFNRYRWRRPATKEQPEGEIVEFQVTAGLIDSGFEAQQNKNVYEFCARWSSIFSPSKGGDQSKTRGATVRTSPIMDDQLDLVWYWDAYFKQGLYYHCIKAGINGAGEPLYWWMPTDIDDEYRSHMKSERVEEKNGKKEWVRFGPNHVADTEKLHEVLRDTIWEMLEGVRDERAPAEVAEVQSEK